MSNVHVKGNKAEGANGGAIYVDAIGGPSRNIINITNSTFTKNKATASGNAIATASGKNVRINIINSLFLKTKTGTKQRWISVTTAAALMCSIALL